MTLLPTYGAQYTGDNFQPNYLQRVQALLPAGLVQRVGSLRLPWSANKPDIPPPVSSRSNGYQSAEPSRVSIPRLGLVLLWMIVVWYSERSMFSSSIDSCQWNKWENWPANAAPHHVVLITDPQLVDPHTYPGRPWPLSSLTVYYTDLYMRRVYIRLQKRLHPDTLFFLGDLFDGGREWSTAKSKSPEERYRKYGNSFWIKEYKRFSRIFFDHFNDGGIEPDDKSVPGRKLIASLPGNHDLGFGSGIQQPVKDRFVSVFGEGNRIDVIGNHSFISIDAVSLSAMDQADPVTGSSGSADGSSSSPAMRAIWQPVQDFLLGAKDMKSRKVTNEILRMKGYPVLPYHQEFSHSKLSPDIVSPENALEMIHNAPPMTLPPPSAFPNVLLTHVPLYRPPDTDCGPLRERGHAIPIHGGYQYQNTLTPIISENVMDKIGAAETAHVYSGDDHDYCDYTHTEFTGQVKETTVKSISWAMGVRKPGFLLVSLWNPIDLSKSESPNPTELDNTIQQHLCLIPDQLGIFIRYLEILLLSLVVLLVNTLHVQSQTSRSAAQNGAPLLPVSNPSGKSKLDSIDHNQSGSSSSRIKSGDDQTQLSARAANSKGRISPPSRLGGYGNLPSISRSATPSKDHDMSTTNHTGAFMSSIPFMAAQKNEIAYDDWGMPIGGRGRMGSILWFLVEFRNQVFGVAWPVLTWYLWIIWHG